MREPQTAGVSYPFGVLKTGELFEIAPKVRVLPLPATFPPFHVNASVLEDDDGWTLVDPGLRLDETRAIWNGLLGKGGALAHKPVRRVLATHHHPDHIGMAGWFIREHGAELWTTRTSWLFARMLQLDAWSEPPPEAALFYRRCGYDADMMARWRERAARNYSVTVEPLPLGFRAIALGQTLRLAGRDWRVRIGHGHAPEHALLHCEAEDLVIAGDQILPTITPNLGVYPTEPEADPIGDWLESCTALAEQIPDQALVVPGHGQPFRGAAARLRRVIEKHANALDRLTDHLRSPRSAVGCFPALYRREITAPLEGLATVEAVAHLNHLTRTGRAQRRECGNGVYEWEALDV
ncbi:MAG: MBL fold metallo-hydrolase [Neomegalonema sp.]|nr:MBL fold metallo-hydrolase [Neomegalonema sp.]